MSVESLDLAAVPTGDGCFVAGHISDITCEGAIVTLVDQQLSRGRRRYMWEEILLLAPVTSLDQLALILSEDAFYRPRVLSTKDAPRLGTNCGVHKLPYAVHAGVMGMVQGNMHPLVYQTIIRKWGRPGKGKVPQVHSRPITKEEVMVTVLDEEFDWEKPRRVTESLTAASYVLKW